MNIFSGQNNALLIRKTPRVLTLYTFIFNQQPVRKKLEKVKWRDHEQDLLEESQTREN